MGENSNAHSEMRLYSPGADRLYLNAEERGRFIAAANASRPTMRAFCLTLTFTGCRLSEARNLRTVDIQSRRRVISFVTLKRRRSGVVREVPIPTVLVEILEAPALTGTQLLWGSGSEPVNRSTAYRWVKQVMVRAGLSGSKASPKGLRHTYGVNAIQCGVPMNMLQKWMGHASMTTTAIYTAASGAEELNIADRMWSQQSLKPAELQAP